MAEPQPDIQSILAALAAQQPAGTASTQTPPGAPGQSYAPPPGAPQAGYQSPPTGGAGYGAPSQQGLPAPAASGSVDLSAIRPVNSGTMSFDDVLSKARAFAAAKGVASYDQPLVYGAESRSSDRPYIRSRSRSPQRDHHNARRGGHGREHGRDRSWSPPSRSRHSPRGGKGRDRSPIRSGGGGDEDSETISIESSLVGLIIGRNGENLRRIESESGCRVQFLSPTDGGPFRQCRISGPAARRAEVKDAINRIIEDSGMGALNRAEEQPSQDAAGGLRDGEDHMQIMVPDRTVGLIIGRGGETIRDLQERSGCHINIVHESKSVNGLRPVNLIGTPTATARAKDFILEIVDSDSRTDAPQGAAPGGSKPPPMSRSGGGQSRDNYNQHNNPYDAPGKVTEAIYVPSDAVGMIIGKGGETIREIQSQAECKINVASSSGPGEVQREISLIGAPASIERAKQLIDEKVEAVKQKNTGGGGRGGRERHDGGGRGGHHDRGHSDRGGNNYSQPPSTNAPPQGASGDASDPYAQYGGYQNYVALWYQSLMYQQQQQGGGDGTPPAGAPPK
ncbi:far upstream element-binding protein 2 [Akanthomyces lecanii RCEF 1005]|uniref:Far upstream element-binding protein 2 n=1 Tax=Akanthomyces lecanii RCEF 1005 TaxID=1081108 RepID=A0A168IZ99_CORDF|nr:far upstream element-binding protein 2 [Akanthomyces lecanii RCEF 1005]